MASANLDLSAGRFTIKGEAGNDLNFAFVGTINTTAYTWEMRIFSINITQSGGDALLLTLTTTPVNGSGIVNTGGSTSTVAITIGVLFNTPSLVGTTLWLELWRTDANNVRTWSKGSLALV